MYDKTLGGVVRMFARKVFLFVVFNLFSVSFSLKAGKFGAWLSGFMGASCSGQESQLSGAWSEDNFSDSDYEDDSLSSKSSTTFDGEFGLHICDQLSASGKFVVKTWESAYQDGKVHRRGHWFLKKSETDEIFDGCAEIKRISARCWDSEMAHSFECSEETYVTYWPQVRWNIACCLRLLQELNCMILQHRGLYCVVDERMCDRRGARGDIPREFILFQDAYAKASTLFNEFLVHASLLGFGTTTDLADQPSFVFGACKNCGTHNKNVQSTVCESCDKCVIEIPADCSDLVEFGREICVLKNKLRLLKRALKALKIQVSNASYL